MVAACPAGSQIHAQVSILRTDPFTELALLRIRERVQQGGHNVPDRDVRRRYGRTLDNLFHSYRPLLDTLRVFDNSTSAPRLIFEDDAGQTTVYDATVYQQLTR